jgi:phosphoglycerol transferase MdoB-like AlkP superfamily enzyme
MKTKAENYFSIYFPFRLVVFYMSSLMFWRLLFIWYNDVEEIGSPLVHALSLDFSMTCGVFLVSFIPWILYLIFGNEFLRKLIFYINVFVWIVICLVEYSSIILYKEWGSTVDSRAISYLMHPNEAWASTKDFVPLWATVFAMIMLVSGVKRLALIFASWKPVSSYYTQVILFVLVSIPVSIIGLRGGLQKLPIVPSDAFYSADMKNNFAAVNKTWYLIYSSIKSGKPFEIQATESEIQDFQKSYQSNECEPDSIYNFKGKNIVFIVLEGWSADMVKYLGGTENVAPFVDSLSEHSIRFTNAFSTGFRTDQGLMCIQSGIPSIHSTNMSNILDKVAKYPSLCQNMEALGYQSSFVYGGDLNFANLYNYLTIQGFDTIINQKNYDSKDDITEWGVPDHIMLKKALEILDGHTGPFYSTLLLMSSHSPFDVPWENEFIGGDIPTKYKSSVRYSDQSLKQFFHDAKTRNWYEDTVFFVMADHGNTHSGYAGLEDQNRFRIPLLVYSPSFESLSNVNIDIPCNHFDLPFTVLKSMGKDGEQFPFGRDIFCHDTTRNAYWNVDVVAGSVGLKYGELTPINKDRNDKKRPPSLLFLDWVKSYFNSL